MSAAREPVPRMPLLDRVVQVRPRPGELAITEQLGPRGKRWVLGLTLASLGALAGLIWWVYRRLGRGTRFYPKGQLQPELWEPLKLWSSWRFLLTGLLNTVKAASLGLLFALAIALLMALLRVSPKRSLRVGGTIYVELFRACALILLIIFPFRAFPKLSILGWKPPSSPFASVVIGLTLYYSTVLAEVVRAGIRSLPKGQSEAAYAIGLTHGQVMRTVILPQALRRMVPTLVSQSASLLKDTSLGFAVTYEELLRRSDILGKTYDNQLQALLAGAGLYIVCIAILTFIANRLKGRT